MTARPAISTPAFGASAASTEPAQKIATPISMTFLRPNSSATMPKASMTPANVSAYALTTHCSDETPVCRSAWTLPRATLTTVLSRKGRNRIVHSTASASGRPRRAAAGRPAVAGIPAGGGTGRPLVLPPASSVSRPQKLARPTFQVPSCRTAVPDWPPSAVWPASTMLYPTVACVGEVTVTLVTLADASAARPPPACDWMIEAKSWPSSRRLMRWATGVLALKKALQLAAMVPAAAELAGLLEAALAEAAGAEEDEEAVLELVLAGVLAADPPLLLLPQAASVTPSAAPASRITGDLDGLIATFSYSRPGRCVQLILS